MRSSRAAQPRLAGRLGFETDLILLLVVVMDVRLQS